MKITGLAQEPVRHIAENLRLDDLEELVAARGVLNRRMLAAETIWIGNKGHGWIGWRDDTGEPVAVWGAYRMNAGTASCWAFGTPGWPHVVRGVTRHIKKIMIPTLLKAGFHRAECRALEKREDTRIWLTSLGWLAEAVLAEFGVRRENFVLYAWTASRAAPAHHIEDDRQGELPLRQPPRRSSPVNGPLPPLL